MKQEPIEDDFTPVGVKQELPDSGAGWIVPYQKQSFSDPTMRSFESIKSSCSVVGRSMQSGKQAVNAQYGETAFDAFEDSMPRPNQDPTPPLLLNALGGFGDDQLRPATVPMWFSRFGFTSHGSHGSHGSVSRATVWFHESMPRFNAPLSFERFGSHGSVHTVRFTRFEMQSKIANRNSVECVSF